jgi:hypothetical protein
MNPPTLNPAAPSFHAILDSVGIDTSRAIRKVSASEGEATAWLRANADVARRAHASMLAEFRTDLDRERVS